MSDVIVRISLTNRTLELWQCLVIISIKGIVNQKCCYDVLVLLSLKTQVNIVYQYNM